jgi:hypothetical protein
MSTQSTPVSAQSTPVRTQRQRPAVIRASENLRSVVPCPFHARRNCDGERRFRCPRLMIIIRMIIVRMTTRLPLRLRRRARRGTATSCGASLGAAAAACSEYSRGTPSTLTGGTRMVPRGVLRVLTARRWSFWSVLARPRYSRGTLGTLTGYSGYSQGYSGNSPRGAGRSGWCWRGRGTHKGYSGYSQGCSGCSRGTPGAHREALVVLVGVGEAEVRADHVALVAQQERLDARRPEVALPVSARVLTVPP